MDLPTDRPPPAPTAAAARRAVFGFGVREIGIGVVALAVLTTFGTWVQRRFSHNREELQAIRVELDARQQAVETYHAKFRALQQRAAEIRAWADAQSSEPLRSWARERSRRFDALVAEVDHSRAEKAFADAKGEIERLCAAGELERAREQLPQLPVVTYPSAHEFEQLRQNLYAVPLADFSRRSPELYRVLRQHEPDLARSDEAALRVEITAARNENVTPQLMLKVDLLAAVAAPDDPVVAEWSTLASALDYFENPDGATLSLWRQAQQAIKVKDWPTATNRMQAIVKSKVRTRQPFRAAFGRALLQQRPDQPAEAYPFLAEAAAAGDKQARAWVAQEDYQQQRFAQAQRWLEASVADGEMTGVPLLLELYQNHGDAAGIDPVRQIGVLERVTDRPDALPEALLMLGRLYETGASPANAFRCYRRAAERGAAAGEVEVARCALRGVGTPESLDLARDAAIRAFTGGERQAAVAMLIELMRRAPDRTAGAVQRMFEQEQVASAVPYQETRVVDGPGVAQLQGMLARYFDQKGQFGVAARFYARAKDPSAAQRHAELTLAHPCDTCGGSGKIQVSAPCPTCGGKGKQICSFCGGTGFIFTPGTPPCAACGGAGTMMQDRKLVTCATCGGTGKGMGSVIKQDCTHCDHGYIRCSACTNGTIKVPQECPDCHGKGAWALTERGEE